MLEQNQLDAAARVLQSMAHPLRLSIIQELTAGEMTVKELYEKLGCSQSMMSQQLRLLETQGLVHARKIGTSKYFSIRNPDFLKLFECMENHLKLVFHL